MKKFFLIICVIFIFSVFCAAASGDGFESTKISARRNTQYKGKLYTEENTVLIPTTLPRRGELDLDGSGCFSYTPDRDFTGKDYFGYRIKDSAGNVSQERTVIIRVG